MEQIDIEPVCPALLTTEGGCSWWECYHLNNFLLIINSEVYNETLNLFSHFTLTFV